MISAEIAVRSGAEMNLSGEVAEACWWLLLRSATTRDAELLAARAIAPTEQRDDSWFRLVLFECAGGLKGTDGDYFARRLMSWVTCLRRLKGMMPLRIPASLTRVGLVRGGAGAGYGERRNGQERGGIDTWLI